MTYIPSINSIVSSGNSTSTPLGVSGVFTGTAIDVSAYSSITVYATASVPSAVNGLVIKFGSISGTWDITTTTITLTAPISPATTTTVSLFTPVLAQYMQVVYTNDSLTQVGGTFRLQTLLQVNPTSTTSGLVALSSGSNYRTLVTADNQANLNVAIANPLSAFGEMSSIEPTPVTQVMFAYGLNNQMTVQYISGSGTITAPPPLLVVSTGISTGNSICQTIGRLTYRAGQGGLARFTAIFTTGVVNTTQIAGIGNSFTVLPTAPIYPTNGFFFGYVGTLFGIIYYNNNTSGISGYNTFIPQTSWNTDICNGSLGSMNKSGMNITPTYGNVYQIKYQYLGCGNIFFYVEDPSTGRFILVHILIYTNNHTITNISNPYVTMWWQANSTTATTGVSVSSGSCGLFLEGILPLNNGPRFGLNFNANASTTLTNYITLHNLPQTNGSTIYTNLSQIVIRNISCASASGGNIIITLQIIKNATFGTVLTYTPVNAGNSIVEYSNTSSTISMGTNSVVLYNTLFNNGSNSWQDLSDLFICANPNDTLTIAIISTSGSSTSVAVTWSEDT